MQTTRFYLSQARRWVEFDTANETGCWIWQGGMFGPKKYARPVVYIDRVPTLLRRIMWEQCRGYLGKMVLRSKCGNMRCCRLSHIEALDHARRGLRWSSPPATSWFETNDQGCWLWTGRRVRWGYGRVMIDGKCLVAHRRAWEVANGKPVPEGLVVRHTCDNPPCCRPDHLLVGTQRDNSRDMASRLRGPAKFDWDTVDRIRQRRAEGLSLRKIAEEFRCSHKTVDKLCKGKTYSVTQPNNHPDFTCKLSDEEGANGEVRSEQYHGESNGWFRHSLPSESSCRGGVGVQVEVVSEPNQAMDAKRTDRPICPRTHTCAQTPVSGPSIPTGLT